MLLLNHPDNFFSFKKYFIRITKLYFCIVLVNIRNIYAKYSECGPIHFICLYNKIYIKNKSFTKTSVTVAYDG